ncbi:hypothetical protein Tco_1569390 [Tanacetum coccineum]
MVMEKIAVAQDQEAERYLDEEQLVFWQIKDCDEALQQVIKVEPDNLSNCLYKKKLLKWKTNLEQLEGNEVDNVLWNYGSRREVGSIRRIQWVGYRIQWVGYGVLEFLGIGTTFDIFQNIHMLYIQYNVLVFSGYDVLSLFPLWSLEGNKDTTTHRTRQDRNILVLPHFPPCIKLKMGVFETQCDGDWVADGRSGDFSVVFMGLGREPEVVRGKEDEGGGGGGRMEKCANRAEREEWAGILDRLWDGGDGGKGKGCGSGE